jgi:hypothetical protein
MRSTSLNDFLVRNDQSWLQCLENSYGALRTSWHGQWVGLPAVLEACVQFLGLNKSNSSLACAQMLQAAEQVAHVIEASFANDGIDSEPLYHNRLHFADALATISLQIAIQSDLSKQTNPEWTACALLACIAHDLGHSGRINQFESELEKHSVELLAPILDACGVTGVWREWIERCIIRSDFALVQQNHSAVQGADFEWDLKWLIVFLNESDVMASASTKFGIGMGEALAREWKKIDFVAHQTVATPAGRKGFLKIITFSSPAAKALGIQVAVDQEISGIR